MNLELGVQNFQTIKLGIHCAQAALILFCWILEIVVFRKSASIDGRPGWLFGLCLLSIPAIIYLTMTVRYDKTRKFAQPYALAAVDAVWCLMWLSGFAAQASYNGATTGTGKDEKDKCDGACGASKAIVGFGAIVWLLFVVTTIMSCYGVMYYNRDGYLPGASRAPYNAQQIDPHKADFSTEVHDDEYSRVNDRDHEIPDHGSYGAGSYGSRHDEHAPGVSFSGGGGYVPPRVEDEETGYGGAYGDASGGRAQYPTAPYEHVSVL